MTPPPSARIRELETLLARIRNAGQGLLDMDMWDRWGSAHASAEERARRETDAANASSRKQAAQAELTALVTHLRAVEPAEIVAWADAHETFLVAFIAGCGQASDKATERFVAEGERTAWAAVRAGTLSFVEENFYYVTIERERYRACFGIDP